MKIKNVISLFILGLLVIITTNRNIESADSFKTATNKVLVLGFDGMDPKILEDLIQQKKLPNFEHLIKVGDFKRLKTSIPPQSPVAWSNFITGMNPGGHGIFDFIHRDPLTMIPYLSTSKAVSSQKKISIGNWVIPLSGGEIKLLRHGKAFWQILDENGIKSTIFRVPANFPPVDSNAYQFSGMGTPDIQGTYGNFSYYTDEKIDKYGEVSGGKIFPIKVVNNAVHTHLPGPVNTFKKGNPESFVDFKVFIDKENPVAKITIQDHQILLNEGEWSEWIGVDFNLVPLLQSVNGICRFYLKEIRPNFKMYVTPVNIDPCTPAMPISTPSDYSMELCEEIGPFYTQGMPEDTKALSENILDDYDFIHQSNIVLEEEIKMLDYELNRFKSGVLFYYFGRVDMLGHMFWRTMDPKHPAYDPSSKYSKVIENTYIEMDAILEKVIKRIDDNTTLIVMSDHGFAPFYRSFNLNTWLKNEGYISLTDNSEGELFQNVNWYETRAYGLGFNGLYFNLIGREKKGIVRPGNKRNTLIKEISEKLLAIRDPKNGEHVITKIYKAEDVYTGPYLKNAPDLIIGYNKGFRASWETTLGKFPEEILKDNTGKWSGSHLMEADLVPGILISNKKIKKKDPALYDLSPTILSEFNIPKQKWMIGNALF